tara:strand:+ start:1211 stop:1411 length:201 start_codon:yes stop_codon:yes gene_type:complete
MTNQEYIIIDKFKIGNQTWYDFSNIPQEQYYITIASLPFSTDRKAINRAKKINSNYEYVIREVVND